MRTLLKSIVGNVATLLGGADSASRAPDAGAQIEPELAVWADIPNSPTTTKVGSESNAKQTEPRMMVGTSAGTCQSPPRADNRLSIEAIARPDESICKPTCNLPPGTELQIEASAKIDQHADRKATADTAPPPANLTPAIKVVGGHTNTPLKPACRIPLQPERAAPAFLRWLRGNGLDDRPWTVDDLWCLWCLASNDLASAGFVLPPRNRFLGALQKQPGVVVQYDKRVQLGGKSRKTTVYSFPLGGSGIRPRILAAFY